MPDLTIPQEAVEAFRRAITASPDTVCNEGGGEEGVYCLRPAGHEGNHRPTPGPTEWLRYAFTKAAPVLLAFHLRGIAGEMRPAGEWLEARNVVDAGPGLVLGTVRASLEATAERLERAGD